MSETQFYIKKNSRGGIKKVNRVHLLVSKKKNPFSLQLEYTYSLRMVSFGNLEIYEKHTHS